MASLRQHDLKLLLEFLRQTYAAQDLRSFRTHLLSGLQSLVPSEINGYNEINLRTQQNEVVYDRPEAMSLPDGNRIFEQHIPEHPLIAYSKGRRHHRAVKISDFLSVPQFHRLGLYSEFFGKIGIEDQMVVSFPAPRKLVIGIAINRSRRNFSERDRLLLNLVYPHLLQACRNAEAWARTIGQLNLIRDALQESAAAVIVLSSTGGVQTMTTKARLFLVKYVRGRALQRDALPDFLQRWVRRQRAALAGSSDVPAGGNALQLQRDDGCLFVRLFHDPSQSILLLEESPQVPERIDGFGLTPRENEVLAWVSHGKTNSDISTILGTSARTVQKHVEHIFQKLGVETRTAAAAKVLAVRQDPPV